MIASDSRSPLNDLANSLENTARRDVRIRKSLTIGSAKILLANSVGSVTSSRKPSKNLCGNSFKYFKASPKESYKTNEKVTEEGNDQKIIHSERISELEQSHSP